MRKSPEETAEGRVDMCGPVLTISILEGSLGRVDFQCHRASPKRGGGARGEGIEHGTCHAASWLGPDGFGGRGNRDMKELADQICGSRSMMYLSRKRRCCGWLLKNPVFGQLMAALQPL